MARCNSIAWITRFYRLVLAGFLFAGRGWISGWDLPSVQLAGPLGTNWVTAGWTDTLNGTGVFDNVALTGAHTEPVVRYFLEGSSTNTFLAEVDRLTDRTAGTYDVTKYGYGHAGDSNNLLVDVYDPRGVRVLRNAYGHNATSVADGRMTGQTDALGNTTSYTIASDNTLQATISVSGTNQVSTVNHTAGGAIAQVTLPLTNAVTQYTYDARGRLTTQTDANGNIKATQYDSLDRPSAQADALGNMTTVEYDPWGHPSATVDANGHMNTMSYTNWLPATIFDPAGTETEYTYGSVANSDGSVVTGLQTSETRYVPGVAFAIVTTNIYYGSDSSSANLKGELESTTQVWVSGGVPVAPFASGTLYQYDANGNRVQQTQTNTVNGVTNTPITTYYGYDAQNRVVRTIDALGHTNTTVYNHLGKVAATTDALGHTTAYVYDPAGNLIQTVYPNGSVSRTTYDEKSRVVYTQDRALPDGSSNTTAAASLNIYDPAGRVIAVERRTGVGLNVTGTTSGFTHLATWDPQFQITTNSAGSVASFTRTVYDLGGRVQYAVDARGTVTQYNYDAADRRTNTLVYTNYTVTNESMAVAPPSSGFIQTISVYDANGNQTAVTNNLGLGTQYIYDQADRLIETVYPLNAGESSRHSTGTEYDGAGNKIATMDEAGVVTGYTYDFRGLLTSVTLDLGGSNAVTTGYAYDQLGNLVTQTDGNLHTNGFQYDALGRRTVRFLQGGLAEMNGYDAVGNLIRHTNFNGVIFTNQYDVVNRLTSHGTAGYQVSYAYTVTGQRGYMSDGTGMTTNIYDGLNRLITNTTPQGTLYYGYDVAGSVVYIHSATSGGAYLGYGYDCLGRLTNVTTSGTNVANYAYDGVGNLATLSYTNGVTNLYQYSAQNRLTNLVWNHGATALARFTYQLGKAGNRTGVAETINTANQTNIWAYDNLYRMTNETFAGSAATGTLGYGLDNVGNRTSRASSVSVIANATSTFDGNDRLTGDTYDANGNTRTNGGIISLYDAEDRLTNYNSGTVKITYNGDGTRVGKTVGGVTTTYLVDTQNPTGYPQVLEERLGGSLSKVYAYGTALINQRQASSGVVRYYGMDGHGSVRFLTDTGGSVSDTYTYDAFGISLGSSGSTANNYLYSGEQWDPDLGMYYLRARYYRPDSGRFWTMDSYEGHSDDPPSLHKYFYCKSNPINGIDPSGNDIIGLSMAMSIGNGLQGNYDAGVTTIGNALIATIRGVQDNLNGQQILEGFLNDTAMSLGIGYLLGKVAQFADELVFGGGAAANACFVAGTPVATDSGQKPIEQIKKGDLVWSWDETTGELELAKVVNTHARQVEREAIVRTSDESIITTPTHPFRVESKGWLNASKLNPGDKLISLNGNIEIVTKAAVTNTTMLVYNFEVEKTHTYFVGERPILVHNACAWGTRQASLPDEPGIYVIRTSRGSVTLARPRVCPRDFQATATTIQV